jgi:hypothetical protein
MLPQAKNLPATVTQFLCHYPITHAIFVELIAPVLTITLGTPTMLRATMPKTPIHKNCKPFAAKKKVRPTRQLLMT